MATPDELETRNAKLVGLVLRLERAKVAYNAAVAAGQEVRVRELMTVCRELAEQIRETERAAEE